MKLIMDYVNNDLGRILKQQRIAVRLTLQELADESSVSSSHLGRIERGERFPSARILRKIARWGSMKTSSSLWPGFCHLIPPG